MAATAVLALLLAACSQGPAPQSEEGVGTAENWTAPHGGADEAGYSRLTEITPAMLESRAADLTPAD